MSPDEAISKFESARGHVMHRANFISEIRKLREALSRNQQERSTGNSKTVGYSSPLNDSLYTEEQPKGRGHPKNRPGKTIVENWRKRDGDSGVSNLQNFQHNQSRSNSHRYDSKSKYGREKQFPKGEKHTRKASSHPYSGETLRSSLTGNWRDRP
ncbi:hypothetical protein NQ315_015956 [Exocentrus adspersus]|uniref:Uncharacterized protein n=1 Tax=Exocentrus adspersus TaxID=1586481 RepID=A0AAV8VJ39_9CUCU|nr:hypothetical protein NQ315_015956 [Exocentrus adspersus]